jgi:hypothetical protein
MALKNNDDATKARWIGKDQPSLLEKLLMKKQGGKPTYFYHTFHNLSL